MLCVALSMAGPDPTLRGGNVAVEPDHGQAPGEGQAPTDASSPDEGEAPTDAGPPGEGQAPAEPTAPGEGDASDDASSSAPPGNRDAPDDEDGTDDAAGEVVGEPAGEGTEAAVVPEVAPSDPSAEVDDEVAADVKPGEAEGEAEGEVAGESDEDLFGDEADDEPWPDQGDQGDADPLPDYDPLRDSPQAVSARHWVRTGIITLSTGGVLLVGAVLMGVSDPCNLDIGNSCQADARNRAALIMGIPAAVLIAGGATALAIGRKRRQALALDLQAARGHLGVGLRGRF